MNFSISIRDELDAETAAFAKFRMRNFAVLRDPDDVDAEGFEILFETREVLSFEGATRSIIFWVEIEERFRGFIEKIFEYHEREVRDKN